MKSPLTEEQLGAAMQEGSEPTSELMTEDELIAYLRIPEVSKSKDYHNVIENLKRMHQLPRIHICGRPLYPRGAIKEWVKGKTTNGK
jgi:hypothetical protein